MSIMGNNPQNTPPFPVSNDARPTALGLVPGALLVAISLYHIINGVPRDAFFPRDLGGSYARILP
jgi:hypothetical protein